MEVKSHTPLHGCSVAVNNNAMTLPVLHMDGSSEARTGRISSSSAAKLENEEFLLRSSAAKSSSGQILDPFLGGWDSGGFIHADSMAFSPQCQCKGHVGEREREREQKHIGCVTSPLHHTSTLPHFHSTQLWQEISPFHLRGV